MAFIIQKEKVRPGAVSLLPEAHTAKARGVDYRAQYRTCLRAWVP